MTPIDVADVIAGAIAPYLVNREQAAYVAAAAIKALDAAGAVVMAPQDIEWGSCPEQPGQPHRVSLSLCSGCLQYDPE